MLLLVSACKKSINNNTTAVYYWKTGFTLNPQQTALLQQTGNNSNLHEDAV
ncbi:hypothetical protein ACFFGT_20600 [Mucilaginibacter angelicae]|uniref:Uncharacterized protein n=1 Tax=Mucilaginibacter angelicae TaxID=869718 RepID=A0ABV6LB11_9SPHI